jgi:hypothetical protein
VNPSFRLCVVSLILPARKLRAYSRGLLTGVRGRGQPVEKLLNAPWSLDQGLKDPLSAVFWPWFGGVGFVFDLPTGQIAAFSTGWGILGSPTFC